MNRYTFCLYTVEPVIIESLYFSDLCITSSWTAQKCVYMYIHVYTNVHVHVCAPRNICWLISSCTYYTYIQVYIYNEKKYVWTYCDYNSFQRMTIQRCHSTSTPAHTHTLYHTPTGTCTCTYQSCTCTCTILCA